MTTSAPYIPPKPLSLWSVVAPGARVVEGRWQFAGIVACRRLSHLMLATSGTRGARRCSSTIRRPSARSCVTQDGVFPKSDLMVNALEHLIGDSIFCHRW